MNVTFYHVRASWDRRRRFMYASAIVPQLSHQGVPCDLCGRGRLYPDWYPEHPLRVRIEGGRRVPDLLGCGAYPLLIVSEAVIHDWQDNQITGFEAFPLEVERHIGNPCMPPLKVEGASYFHIKVTGRCTVDREAKGIRVNFFCPRCKFSEIEDASFDQPFILDPTRRDGSDLFIDELFPCVTFCTERVLTLASANRRTNFRFTRPEEYWDVENAVAVT
jgi:hypothetical protein